MTVATLVVATREVKGVHPDERRTTSDGTSVSPRQANRDGVEAAWLGPAESDIKKYCKSHVISSIFQYFMGFDSYFNVICDLFGDCSRVFDGF